ncbi:T9SS type A sorting domain-containing protein [Hymenobacter tibetensis]|uniref:T9SS type A sorting domain-containing protein n=1 Tax=Hymenobacter tibetensis TaxID=497967 RepID=A0ABY4CSA8_9BACT|nr:T9SS type A sorting domain-containing protein [Hymenobacter tibetensis]UOG73120.1 T9SS type A sorting domain-containing protein [Hymenobacter tibetensis]
MKQTFTELFAKPFCWKSQKVYAGILVAYCLAGPKQAQAQDYFIKDDFRTNSAANFRVGGNATLTGTSGTDAGGYLRLTTNAGNQRGFAISTQTFNPVNGFSISFEYFSYGGTTTDSQQAKADGISLFLIDGTQVTSASAFVPGGYGGSLGYAPLVAGSINTPGATGGFIGIGLDEFGGYSAGIEGKNGGPGRVISGVAIRGAGNATTSNTAYPYITGKATGTYTISGGTRTLNPGGFGIDVATSRAQNTSPDYRRVFVDVFPISKGSTTYKVTVRIQNGPSTVTTVIDNYTFTSATQVMPASLRIGFAASTGGSTNFHEVRDLQIVRPPVANNDVVFTSYRSNTPVTFSPLTNDEASGSSLDVATLDLDPTTVAIDRNLSVPEGTFAIGTDGAVTFTPSGNFAGTFTVPYTVQSILKSISNQGTITINVTGADIATTLNGPTAVNVGSSVTYTTTTSNVGIEAGANVVPKLVLTGDISITQRPANSSVTTSGTGTAKVTTITFAAIPSLSPSDTPIENPVAFTLNSGSVTGASSFTTAVPDPSTANNAANLATGGYSLTGISNGCGGPGKDGPGPIGALASDGSEIVVNTYFQGQASVGVGATSITLAGSGTGYDTPIMPGDLVLVMQMQGATINSTNTSSYGALSNVTAGVYEYAVAAPNTNVSYAGGGTLILMKGLTNAYTAAAATSSAGPQRFQVIRVPQYSSYNAAGTATTTGAAWNGTTGGVVVLDVVGVTTFGTTTTAFNMTSKGFRGGGGVRFAGISTGYSSNDYVNIAGDKGLAGAHGSKGEGIVGTPRYVRQTNTAFLDLGQEAYPGGSVGRGAPGNAGGGGTDAAVTTNTGNTGGGGGSNAISSDNGGNGGNYSTATVVGGLGATAPGLSAGGRLFMGGGGGAGSSSTLGAENGNGANGGGIIILRTGTVSGTGVMNVRGGNGGSTTANGAGGGGGGGSVLITSSNSLATVTINADGGNGGNTTSATTVSPLLGAGGGGSGGVVYYNAPTDPPTVRTAGAAGTARATTNGNATTNGSGPGISGPEIQYTATGISATLGCRPDLDVFLRTNTPQVVRGQAMQATYTLTVVNNGGAATDVSALVTLANGTNTTTGGSATGTASGLFKYKSTSAATITLADKTVVALTTTTGALNSYSAPDAASSAPAFSGIDIPAGAILTITFQVDMATTAVNNTPYQSGAQVVYLDPTRSTASRMITPGGTYQSGTTAAPGTNYLSTSSTGEDVSIARPLPVELKQFSALAIRQDAALTWVTASEKNSDRFEVERSLDGLHFEVIGSVKGQGYSNREHTYRYTDASAAQRAVSSIVYYRLHQIDADGADTYSGVEAVRFEKSVQTAIRLYPNPAQAQATLDLREVPAGNYQVQILDMTGRVLSQQTLSGKQVYELSTTALAPGSYVVQVSGNSVQLALRLLHN